MWCVVAWLVVLRRISVVVGLVFQVRVEVLIQRLVPVGCVIEIFRYA
jgi:hypothetical protein